MTSPQNTPYGSTSNRSKGSIVVWVGVGVAAVILAALGAALLLAVSSANDDLTTGEVKPTPALPPVQAERPQSATSGGEAGEVQGAATALPPLAGEGPDPAAGVVAPTLQGVNFAGDPVVIGAAGEPQVLVFLAHWCPVCQREVPGIVAWADSGGDTRGVEVIGVATSIDRTRGNWPPGEWLRREGWPYQTFVDNDANTAAQAFGLSSFPHFVAIDSSGRVAARASGELTQSEFAVLVDAARASSK